MHESEFENQHKVRWEMNIEIASSFYLKMENYLKFPILGWLLVTFGTHRSSKSRTERRARTLDKMAGISGQTTKLMHTSVCLHMDARKAKKKESRSSSSNVLRRYDNAVQICP